MLIAFLRFSIHRDSMGQQLRVQIKRKRRRADLQRKKASQRVATKRPVPAKATGTERIRSGRMRLFPLTLRFSPNALAPTARDQTSLGHSPQELE